MAIPAIHRFSFQAQELIQKLRQTSRLMLTGYWHCKFPASDSSSDSRSWYLALSQGRVIFSGTQQPSWTDLTQVLQRYVPQLRSEDAVQSLARLGQWFGADHYAPRSLPFPHLLNELYKLDLITPPQVERALRLKILADCDTYLFERSGHAEFLPLPQLHSQSLLPGLAIEELLSEAMERQSWWSRLRTQIPSMGSMPVLNRGAVTDSHFTIEQKQRLEALVASGKTLDNIAFVSAQDDLEIAKVFAKLINQGVISLRTTPLSEPEVVLETAPEAAPATPEIVVVDDSPVLLRQFESLVAGWGYVVKSFSNPIDALQTLSSKSQPTLIFLDINMPDVTGFDLVKQIRRFPDLDSVPLVMLTAERTLSNNWRARWSGCKFLTKPLTPSEVPQFQMELRMLLAELAPLQSFNPVKTRSGYYHAMND